MEKEPPIADLPDGVPATVSPWIVGVLADDGIVRSKHSNLIACIEKYNAEIAKGAP